jgi:hypothetical protein
MEGVGRIMPPPSPIYDFVEDLDTGIWSWDGGILEKFFSEMNWKEIDEAKNTSTNYV